MLFEVFNFISKFSYKYFRISLNPLKTVVSKIYCSKFALILSPQLLAFRYCVATFIWNQLFY